MKEEVWEAIIECNPLYDGKFFYGVATTGIFCRPSCKSKRPKRENVRVFSSMDEAVEANFRPCKRCRPDHARWPDEDLVENVIKLIEHCYPEPLTLSKLADMLHISPYHLHRTFKRVFGQTPAEYLRATRLKAAQQLLSEKGKTVTEIAMAVGFSNAGHFTTVFLKQVGLVPSAWRRQSEVNRTKV